MTKESYWNHFYILATIIFTVYGQVILKWRIGHYGRLPNNLKDKVSFIMNLLMDPLILSALIAAFIASLFWMMAMTKFDLSYAYPFMGITYVIIFFVSVLVLGESFSIQNLVGIVLVVFGIVLLVQ